MRCGDRKRAAALVNAAPKPQGRVLGGRDRQRAEVRPYCSVMPEGPPSGQAPRSNDLAATQIIRASNSPKARTGRPACLVVIVGTKMGQQIHLDRTLTFGRDPACGVHLDSDMISRRHAKVEAFNGVYQLDDLGSTNGSFVNDIKVTTTRLKDGDRVGLGKVLMKFLDSDNIEAEYHKEIYNLMTIDGLTGVSNKRHFNDSLASEFSRPASNATPMSVLVFDVDHFKQVNDTRGHAAGDAVLRQLARTARAAIPSQYLLGRVGGEEFAVVLPGVDVTTSLTLAEHLRAAVANQQFQFEQQLIPITISVGSATRAVGAQEGPLDLFKRADQALYRAKSSGRNRVCI